VMGRGPQRGRDRVAGGDQLGRGQLEVQP
jgi:hypothetical protein